MSRPTLEVADGGAFVSGKMRGVRFTLTYRGGLASNARSALKHNLRLHFHPQLVALWAHEPLSNWSGAAQTVDECGGHRFQSIVHSKFKLRAELDLLMLRPGTPGAIISSGDIDNRLKTLFDGLRAPNTPDEIPAGWAPTSDQAPLFCLLEDDRLITRFNVEVAELLGTPPPGAGDNYCELTIRVRVWATASSYASVGLIS